MKYLSKSCIQCIGSQIRKLHFMFNNGEFWPKKKTASANFTFQHLTITHKFRVKIEYYFMQQTYLVVFNEKKKKNNDCWCKRQHVLITGCYLYTQVCDFMKNYTDTSLHVYFAGNLRIYNCNGCCSRWYFKFNGAECSSSGTIAGAFYMSRGVGRNLHRHRHIEGHCNNIHKGKVRVGFWVGKCTTGEKLADAHTGWGTPSRIFIEEVAKAQQ